MACHILLERSWWRLQLCFRPISIRGLHTNICAPKVAGVLVVGISKQNDIWLLALWLGTKYTIRGKVVASPKFGPWWVLWVRICPWFVCAPKCSNYALTNLLFSLCKFVWVIELLVNLPSPIPDLQHAPLPPKCYEPGSVPQLLLLPLITFGLAVESIKELGGASKNVNNK